MQASDQNDKLYLPSLLRFSNRLLLMVANFTDKDYIIHDWWDIPEVAVCSMTSVAVDRHAEPTRIFRHIDHAKATVAVVGRLRVGARVFEEVTRINLQSLPFTFRPRLLMLCLLSTNL